ncbi:hypothetical protein ACIHDR_17440 [Nocardia sp. NPDC052278]|uniref:hypothetical protein n=1 Tax=unclassified Nocardia TaxID=2637762 RepID=UPI00369FAFCD
MTWQLGRLGKVGSLGIFVAALAACGNSHQAASVAVTAIVPAATASPAGASVATSSGPAPRLMFPNTTFFAAPDSFDASTQMLIFHVRKHVAGGPNNGHFEADPDRPQQYRLLLAAGVRIASVFSLCSPNDPVLTPEKSCSKAEFTADLPKYHGVLQLHVDATDHIDAIEEQYQP